MKEFSVEGTISQRDLSKRIGLSLGSVNYIVKELIKKGYVKAQKFKNSQNKAAYIYVLTPQGINARVKQTQYFLQVKLEEYERLKMEIDELKKDASGLEQDVPEKEGTVEGDMSL